MNDWVNLCIISKGFKKKYIYIYIFIYIYFFFQNILLNLERYYEYLYKKKKKKSLNIKIKKKKKKKIIKYDIRKIKSILKKKRMILNHYTPLNHKKNKKLKKIYSIIL